MVYSYLKKKKSKEDFKKSKKFLISITTHCINTCSGPAGDDEDDGDGLPFIEDSLRTDRFS